MAAVVPAAEVVELAVEAEPAAVELAVAVEPAVVVVPAAVAAAQGPAGVAEQVQVVPAAQVRPGPALVQARAVRLPAARVPHRVRLHPLVLLRAARPRDPAPVRASVLARPSAVPKAASA